MNPIEELTGEEMRRIEELIAVDFKDATKEDIELYAKYKSAIAMQEELFTKEEAAIAERLNAAKQLYDEKREIAHDTLKAKRDYAKARLEALRKKVN